VSQDIFQFWSEMPENAYVHPRDEQVLKRMDHNFSPYCLPGVYAGRPQTAPVVLLFLSPGLDQGDPEHGAGELGRKYYARQRTGNCKLPSVEEHPSAYQWLNRIIKQFGIEYEEARTSVATLNIGAYKSKTFDDWSMLAALPSSRASLDWAQDVLFPQAERGERVVVCLRSPKYWGLKVGAFQGSFILSKLCPQRDDAAWRYARACHQSS
jgi:hypothetical protein